MNISYYTIEHTKIAIYGDGYVLSEIILMLLSTIVIFFFTFALFILALRSLVKLKKIKYISDTMLIIALILSFATTGFIIYTSIKDIHKNPYLVIYYENPTQKTKIQKSVLITDMCSEIENGQLTSRNPMTMPLTLRRKTIKITKTDEELIHKAEIKFHEKVKKEQEEKYADRLEIID